MVRNTVTRILDQLDIGRHLKSPGGQTPAEKVLMDIIIQACSEAYLEINQAYEVSPLSQPRKKNK